MTAINRILIVDDEDNVRRMLSTAFALQGFETHCANNGRTALHLFADIHPDVVLMDIRMPEMDGIKALKEMRSHETRTPVILMTAYAEVETAVEALRCGAFDYVIKPFDLDELNLIVPVNEKRDPSSAPGTEHQLAMGAHSHQQPGDDGHLQRHRQNCPFSGQLLD